MKDFKNKKPNLFIVGARKTGSTSLYHYLKQHPEIFMSPVKEPHFFSQNLKYHIHLYHTEKEYLSLFEGAKDEKILGEVSTSYLDTKQTPIEISKFNPNVKIIIILRNPVELVHSMHYEFFFRGRAVEDFSQELEIQRRSTSHINYLELVKNIPSIVKSYINIFGEQQVHILSFENLTENTPSEFKKILQFLEVYSNFIPDFKIHNTSSKPHSKLVAKLLNSKFVQRVGQFIYKFIPGANRIDPFAWNKKSFEKPELNESQRAFLDQELESTKVEFEALLNKLQMN